MMSDKYAKEFQNVFNSISVMELDPRLLRDSRQTEIDFVNQMDVYRKRPRQWASNIPVIPTKWAHMNEGCAKQHEYHSRLCMKKIEQWNLTDECVMSDAYHVFE